MGNSKQTTTKTIMEIPFGITREEILNLAAQKLVDAYCGEPDLEDIATRMIRENVTNLVATKLTKRIDDFLVDEMKKLLDQEIVPVDIWGEREGNPTTIRAQLAKRARDFWDVRVNSDGREEHYGGQPRSKVLLAECLKEEFTKAIKANVDIIVTELNNSLKADATKLITEHIDKLITLRKR